jgi:hypothetical protein
MTQYNELPTHTTGKARQLLQLGLNQLPHRSDKRTRHHQPTRTHPNEQVPSRRKDGVSMEKADYQNMSKEELIDLLIKRERYNKTLQAAIRSWAMGLLDELKKYRQEQ